MSEHKLTAKQCTFTAEMQLRERSDEEQRSTPFTAVARTGEALKHAYWGTVVHDMDGMRHKPRIPVDYNHTDTIVGYANKFNTDTGDLQLSGALTPSKHEEHSMAEQIIDKGEQGVPWEMSINFAGDLKIEEIPEGEQVTVNQREFTGPLTVIREWPLRGVAVTPYGHDSGTALEFSDDEVVNVTIIEKETEMSVEQATPETEVEVKTGDEAVDVADQDTVEADAAVETEGEEKKEQELEVAAELSETDPKSYMAEFGRVQGALYFADQVPLDEARKLENQRLAKENAELRARLEESEGLDEPTQFSQSKDSGNEPDVLTAIPGTRVEM